MLKNVGTVDRVVRLFFAALLGFLALTTSVEGWLETGFYVVAAYLAISAILGHCLVFRALDIDSHFHGGEYHGDPIE